MKVIILGGGLAGISLAHFLQDDPRITAIDILEKENEPGGLCRSFLHDGRMVDIGPHIFFSKDKDTLGFMKALLGKNQHELRRSNRIIHQGRLVQYPFENDLSKLSEEDRDYCVWGFLHNPYRHYPADNMLQFFLKTFGEGITNLYLRPYNEKIWKFDPAYMDTQMVERIPRPPDEDILRSAAGETVDGYTHQLYFTYPKTGGTSSLIEAFISTLGSKVNIHTSCEVLAVSKVQAGWQAQTTAGTFEGDMLVSCMPVNILTRIYAGISADLAACGKNLCHNDIMIAVATVKKDLAGDNYAFMTADSDVVFHRLSKVDFLGSSYHKEGTATYMMEYTYHDASRCWSDEEYRSAYIDGLQKVGLIHSAADVTAFTLKRYPYAYVVYDIWHGKNMAAIRRYFTGEGVYLNGRFGNFEYWNMDTVISESRKLAERIKSA